MASTSSNPPKYLSTPPSFRVLVSNGKKEFLVHSGLVVERSGFFRKEMQKPLNKGAELRKVELLNVETEIFEIYAALLYTSTLAVQSTLKGGRTVESAQNEYVKLSKLYVLAETIDDEEIKATALSAIDAGTKRTDPSRCFPGDACVRIIYSGTTFGNPARRQLLSYYVEYAGGSFWSNGSLLDVPRDFLRELCGKLILGRVPRSSHNDAHAKLAAAEQNSRKLNSELSRLKQGSSPGLGEEKKTLVARLQQLQTNQSLSAKRIKELEDARKSDRLKIARLELELKGTREVLDSCL